MTVEEQSQANRTEPWDQRVAFDPATGIAYHPRQVILHVRRRREELNRESEGVRELFDWLQETDDSLRAGVRAADKDGNVLIEFGFADGDSHRLISTIDDLRAEGFDVQANHVFFAHGLSANPLYGNPLYGNPLYGNPLYGNPLYGNPLYGNPLYGNPLYRNPLYGNAGGGCGCSSSGGCGSALEQRLGKSAVHANTAEPAQPLSTPSRKTAQAPVAKVVILDSGLAGKDQSRGVDHCPPLLAQVVERELDPPDIDGVDGLDPVAGHGTFIAGIIDLLAPGLAELSVLRVFEVEGDVNEWTVAQRLNNLPQDASIVNLSFGGYLPEYETLIARAVRKLQRRGTVVVASAGNDGCCRPSFPASLPGVVGVAALGRCGPAPFTNWGPWVRACAPGVDLVSTFYTAYDGPRAAVPGLTRPDPDKFDGWARWSGTSFAAPVVAAALVREMAFAGVSPSDAVRRIIDAPGLARLPNLGTVVNLAMDSD